MSQISVTAGEGRLVPLPGRKTPVKPGDVIQVEENDLLIYRLLEHGDLVRMPGEAVTEEAVIEPAAAAPASKGKTAAIAAPASTAADTTTQGA